LQLIATNNYNLYNIAMIATKGLYNLLPQRMPRIRAPDMALDTPNLSKTDRNLWSAIISEALAYLKYNSYAHQALQEGHPEVAQIFQEVAGAETIHSLNHLRVAGATGSTLDNLRDVLIGEAKEAGSLYPRMILDALAEGRKEAVASFALAMERERHHLEMFAQALTDLEAKLASGEQPQSVPGAQLQQSNDGRAPLPAGDRLSHDTYTYVTATKEIDRERWRVASLSRLREVVFGAQDGLLSTVALVTSVAVAVGEATTVLVAGLAAALAGMISMGTGSFLGSRAEQDVQRAEIAREAKELELNPAEELAELTLLYQREGKSYEEARRLADEIAQDRDLWLRTLVEKELGISAEETASPVKDALTMGISFILAALVPIWPYLFLDGRLAMAISVIGALSRTVRAGGSQGPPGTEIANPPGPGGPRHRRRFRHYRFCPGRCYATVDGLKS
jgi:VIT1/CCC1 family predicted Fe2+/Mn2+ transporter/rubrerythrin